MRRKTFILLGVVAAILMASSVAMAAPIPAIGGFSSATTTTNSTSTSSGWDFTTSTPITINSLGYLDSHTDGLAGPHQVGIFDSNGLLLGSATVPSGFTGTLDGCFRYADLSAPITLQSGQTYTIAAVTNGGANSDPIVSSKPAGFTTAQGITVGANRTSTATSTLSFPTVSNTQTSQSFFGPNFTFQSTGQASGQQSPVPEPSVALMLLTGIFGFALYRRKSG